jgi:hypothetical protein
VTTIPLRTTARSERGLVISRLTSHTDRRRAAHPACREATSARSPARPRRGQRGDLGLMRDEEHDVSGVDAGVRAIRQELHPEEESA